MLIGWCVETRGSNLNAQQRRDRRVARVAVKCVRAELHDRDGAQDNDTLEMCA